MSVVTTEYATALSGATMTLTGTLDNLEGQVSLNVWFEWGATTAYGNSTTPVAMTATGLASAYIDTSGLTPFHTAGDVYHYTIKATDGSTTWSGVDRRFVFLGDYTDEPYVIDNEMSTGTLTNLSVYDDVLMLDYFDGMYEEAEFTSIAITGGEKVNLQLVGDTEFSIIAITGGEKVNLQLVNAEFTGIAITGGSKT